MCYYCFVAVIEGDYTMFKGKDTKCVMVVFAVISLILVYMMINNFKVIDCCYFILVLCCATKYLYLSKD